MLDDVLIQRSPGVLDEYYSVMDSMDYDRVATAVNLMTNKPAARMAEFIHRFAQERFLYDYADDVTLLKRLNNVMQRVRLPEIPDALLEFLPAARGNVTSKADELMTAPVP